MFARKLADAGARHELGTDHRVAARPRLDDHALPSGALVPVLREFHHAQAEPMLALYTHQRHRLPRAGAMLEFLVEEFAGQPWRTSALR